MRPGPLNAIAERLVSKNRDYLSDEVLERAVVAAQGGDKKAEELVCRTCSRLVYRFVRRRMAGPGEADDLFQEGMMGLLRAMKTFDPQNAKKAKFCTYAVFWIQAFIHRAKSRSSVVREAYRSISDDKFTSVGFDDNFSQYEDDPEEKRNPRQLIDPLENPEEMAIRREIQRLVRMQAAQLKFSKREKAILDGRILSGEPRHKGRHSLDGIGSRHGVSKECIRISERKMEKRLRSKLKKLAEEVN